MHTQHDHVGGSEIKVEDAAICPVMHLPVSKKLAKNEGLVRQFDGKSYYLCCSSCIGSFEENPAAYAHSKGLSQ